MDLFFFFLALAGAALVLGTWWHTARMDRARARALASSLEEVQRVVGS